MLRLKKAEVMNVELSSQEKLPVTKNGPLFDDDENISTANDLLNLNDNVGDTNDISFKIDVGRRELPFLYLDGEIIKGKSGETHTMALNQWCKENNIDQSEEGWWRLKPKQISELTKVDEDSIGFGHISNDMAFIEDVGSCDINTMLNAIQQTESFKKIYEYFKNEFKVTRLAKVKLAYDNTYENTYNNTNNNTKNNTHNNTHNNRNNNSYDNSYNNTYNNADNKEERYTDTNNTNNNTYNNTYNNTNNNTRNNTNNNTDNMPAERMDPPDYGWGGKIQNSKTLKAREDKVGDTTEISSGFNVDVKRRESPFLFIDGEVISGKYSDSHSKLLARWMRENGLKPSSEQWYRQTEDKVKRLVDKDKVGFGSISSNMVFIEPSDSCTIDEMFQAFDKSKYDKIYEYDKYNDKVTRLAKKK